MKFIVSVLIIMVSSVNFAQKGLEEQITRFYSDVNSGDAKKVESHFNSTGSISTISADTVFHYFVDDFIKLCPDFKSNRYKEHVTRIVLVSSNIKQLTYHVYFDFYKDGKFSYNGIDEIILLADNNKNYLIDKIYSSEYVAKDNMENYNSDKEYIDIKLNKWHLDVAEFNLDAYFKFMHPNFIFLGTDPKERWTKQQFYKFCKPYFEKKATRNFKLNWRNVYQEGKVVWFEESLDTWMEECRGSGVLVYADGEWKLTHYNLTVLIENEKMKKFLKLRSK